MRKGLRIFLIVFVVLLIAVGASLWKQHTYQRDYQAALENSNFLNWCGSVEEESLHTCYISRGTGANSVGRELTVDEIRDLCEGFHEVSVADIALSEDGKGYAMVDEQETRLTFRDTEGEYILRYRPHNPTELYLGGWGDAYGKRQILWTTDQSLIDFVLTHVPTK